jgi:FtsP/CotA-like multicopper oxidase with cupredoxin domain
MATPIFHRLAATLARVRPGRLRTAGDPPRPAVRRRVVVLTAVAVAVVGPLGWFWYDSLLPSTYSVADMGYADFGGGPETHEHPSGVSVADLTGDTAGTPDVAVTLTARQETFTLASGETVAGYTVNHQSPGPVIRAVQGDLIEVTLVNESVRNGVTLHWHGVDLPNAADGVAGVTQDAVRPGGRYVYRFRADDAGTYWYHSHQRSHEQVPGGLFGVLVIDPRPEASAPAPIPDAIAAIHTYRGLGTISGRTGLQRVPVPAGDVVRLRVVNTDEATIVVSVFGTRYRVLAVDAREVNEPTEVDHKTVTVGGGGRLDLEIPVPEGGPAVRVQFGVGAEMLAIGPIDAPVAPLQALTGALDLLSYGSPAALGFDPHRPDRRFSYRVGRRFGFLDGRPGSWWTVNGNLYPDIPMFMVREGDVVVMTIENSFGSLHPMHLHGHHAVVLERNGVPATGSPWWTDTLDVEKGSKYVIAFVADNPGIWMDHCHNLTHANTGLVAHVAYIGVNEPFRIGGNSGNHPS